jgi:hypothetical protein
MGAGQCDRRCGIRRAIAQAVRHVGRNRFGDPCPGSCLVRARTGAFSRAESSITIEVTQISPSIVSGTGLPVRPASPYARARAWACSQNAIAAAPAMAPAVVRLMTRSAAITGYG